MGARERDEQRLAALLAEDDRIALERHLPGCPGPGCRWVGHYHRDPDYRPAPRRDS